MSDKYSIPRAKFPEEVGVSSKEVLEFLRDAEENGLEFHSFMIIRHGKVACECFREPFTKDLPHAMYSVSKTITATAIGLAIDEGFLTLDTRLVDVFPEYAEKRKNDKRLAEITVRHLITMTAGKAPSLLADKGKIDWIEDYFTCPWYGEPGEFRYVNENMFMLCAIIRRTTGLSVREFLTPRFFDKLGIDVPFWETDENGVEAGGWGSYIRTEDFAKMMLCYEQGGKLNGQQIIPAQWAAEAGLFHSDNSFCNGLDSHNGYGYALWRNGGCLDSFRADGMFSQFGIVFENDDAVFVMTSGIANEQEARDLIWRHFPKGFCPEGDSTAVPDLKKLLAESKIDNPSVSAHSPREAELNTKRIKIKKRVLLDIIGFPVSMLPLAVTYMTTDKAGNIDDIELTFSENECAMSWREGDESNSIVCGMDGHQRYGTMILGKISYIVCSTAEWLNDDELLIHVRPVTTVAKRSLRFTFRSGGKVSFKPSSTPSVADIAATLADSAADIISSPLVLKIAKFALKYVPPLVEPRHNGKLKDR